MKSTNLQINKPILRSRIWLRQTNGFTLIELLVSIAIIATLIGLALPNYLNARARAKDVRKKQDLQQMKSALQLYYNDYRQFPADSGGPFYNVIKGCGAVGTAACPCSATLDFAAGGSGCGTVYMTKLPTELTGTSVTMSYRQVNTGDDFCLKVPLENASDADITASQGRCAAKCSGISGTDYAVCSE